MGQSKGSTLSVGSTKSIDSNDDDAVANSFLTINRNIVKTAHEPKPPKDYVDSSKDVIAAADKQKEDKNEEKKQNNKGPIRHGPTISVADADNLNDKDDEKEQLKSDDKNKKTDNESNEEKPKSDDKNKKSDQ